MPTTHSKPSPSLPLFLLCWLMYFSSYLGRLNFSAVMPEMMQEGVLTMSQAGLLNTVFFVTYAAGQLILGMLADRASPGRMILLGCFVTAAANACFGLCQGFVPMLLLRGAIGFFSAMLWPPVLRIFSMYMNEDDRIKYSIHMTSAVAAGTLGAYLLSAGMLQLFGWRAAFIAPAILMAGLGFVWLLVFPRFAPAAVPSSAAQSAPAPAGEAPLSLRATLLVPGVLVALVPVLFHGALKDGMSSFVPTLISDVFKTPATFSLLLSTVMPIVNLSGAVAAQFVLKKLGGNELLASAVFFCLAGFAMAAMALFPSASLVLSIVLLSVTTSCMLAVNTLLVSVLPLRFGAYGRVSTLSGGLNALGYLGSAIASTFIGFTVEHAGWSAAIWSWFVICLIATLVLFFGRRAARAPG